MARRLIDRLLAERPVEPPWIGPIYRNWWDSGFKERLEQAVVVVADNVAEWLYAGTEQEFFFWNEDFPTLAPPFPLFWVENARPSAIHSREYGDQDPVDTAAKLTGILFEATRKEPGDGDGWWLFGYPFTYGQKGLNERQCMGPFGQVVWSIDSAGRMATVPQMTFGWPEDGLMPALHGIADATQALMFPAGLAISFMHCKNVERRAVTPDERSQRAHRRKHGRPLVSYHVLEIDPMRRTLEREGATKGVDGVTKALHIVRGHFATYTDQAPLFGRVTGTFWKPMHARGSASEGVAEKTYKVGKGKP